MPDSIPWAPERALEGPKGPEVCSKNESSWATYSWMATILDFFWSCVRRSPLDLDGIFVRQLAKVLWSGNGWKITNTWCSQYSVMPLSPIVLLKVLPKDKHLILNNNYKIWATMSATNWAWKKRYPFLLWPLEPLDSGRKPFNDKKLNFIKQFSAILPLMIVEYPSIVDI